MKYALYIDYKVNSSKAYEYRTMNAKTLEEAIEEADNINYDNIYLMRIMKQIGKSVKVNDWREMLFEAIMCKRSNGWHRNTEINCENRHVAIRSYTKDWECYEAR